MQQWEYCYLYGIKAGNPMDTVLPRIASFKSSKPQINVRDLGKKIHEDEILGVAETIAKLGEEGWEMVSATNTQGSILTLFFKRPIEGTIPFEEQERANY